MSARRLRSAFVSTVQVADQTFVAAPPQRVAEVIAQPQKWRRWWPDLQLTVREDRGDKGIRWVVTGALDGTMEVWLEPALDGVIVHYFLHAEPKATGDPAASNHRKLNHRRRVAGKVMTFECKRELEGARAAGEPPAFG